MKVNAPLYTNLSFYLHKDQLLNNLLRIAHKLFAYIEQRSNEPLLLQHSEAHPTLLSNLNRMEFKVHNIQVTVTATGIAHFTYCTVIPCTLCTEIFCNDVHIIGPSSSVCVWGGGGLVCVSVCVFVCVCVCLCEHACDSMCLCVCMHMRTISYYNSESPNLSLCVCLFPHKICALQGIVSRHSMPVEGLGRHVLGGVPFT